MMNKYGKREKNNFMLCKYRNEVIEELEVMIIRVSLGFVQKITLLLN
jgi:hypothetical protein